MMGRENIQTLATVLETCHRARTETSCTLCALWDGIWLHFPISFLSPGAIPSICVAKKWGAPPLQGAGGPSAAAALLPLSTPGEHAVGLGPA